jgi:hypothetical protein
MSGLLTKEEALETKEQHPTVDTRDFKKFHWRIIEQF